jgi:hypothetical protein
MKFVKYECMLVNHMDVYNFIGEWSTMVTNIIYVGTYPLTP